MSSDKKTVVLSLGPIHLFWTTGVYYLFELSRAYHVILIAWDDYKQNLDFKKVAAGLDIGEIIYVPVGGSLRRNWFEARAFGKLAREQRISLVFQHAYVCADNLYLQHWVRKRHPGCKFITYQNGMEIVKSPDEDFRARIAIGIGHMRSRHRLPFAMVRILYMARIRLLYLINFTLLPLLFAGAILRPEINVYTGKRPRWRATRKSPPCDYVVAYTEEEIGTYRSRPEAKAFTCALIRHPMEDNGKECNRLVYGAENIDEANLIALFPSGGSVETSIAMDPADEPRIIHGVAEKWAKAISILKAAYPDYRMAWKLHPAVANSPTQLAIQNHVSRCHPSLEIIDPSSNAQQWVLRARLVVSEVSSVLWWASFWPGKEAISLDVFNSQSGDEMKYHSGVKYCNDLDALKDILAQPTGVQDQRTRPTLGAFINSIQAD